MGRVDWQSDHSFPAILHISVLLVIEPKQQNKGQESTMDMSEKTTILSKFLITRIVLGKE